MKRTHQNDEARDNASHEPNERFDERIPIAEEDEDDLFEHVWERQRRRKGPSENASRSKPEYALRGPEATSPIHEGRRAKHAGVHGEARGQERGTRMEVSRARDCRDEEEEPDSAVEGDARDLEQDGLAERAEEGETGADEVEFGHLRL